MNPVPVRTTEVPTWPVIGVMPVTETELANAVEAVPTNIADVSTIMSVATLRYRSGERMR